MSEVTVTRSVRDAQGLFRSLSLKFHRNQKFFSTFRREAVQHINTTWGPTWEKLTGFDRREEYKKFMSSASAFGTFAELRAIGEIFERSVAVVRDDQLVACHLQPEGGDPVVLRLVSGYFDLYESVPPGISLRASERLSFPTCLETAKEQMERMLERDPLAVEGTRWDLCPEPENLSTAARMTEPGSSGEDESGDSSLPVEFNEGEARQRRQHKPHVCDVCFKAFAKNSALVKHKLIHSEEKPHKCDVCGKSFNQKIHLVTHQRTHTGERPYECEVCRKTFAYSGDLSKHKRTHTGERPFECDVCFKSFGDSGHLTSHKRIHTGERPLKCDVCAKSFMDSSALSKHKRTHEVDKPYPCDECPKSFCQNRQLVAHKRSHTGERPFDCEMCRRGFATKSSLLSHQRNNCAGAEMPEEFAS